MESWELLLKSLVKIIVSIKITDQRLSCKGGSDGGNMGTSTFRMDLAKYFHHTIKILQSEDLWDYWLKVRDYLALIELPATFFMIYF